MEITSISHSQPCFFSNSNNRNCISNILDYLTGVSSYQLLISSKAVYNNLEELFWQKRTLKLWPTLNQTASNTVIKSWKAAYLILKSERCAWETHVTNGPRISSSFYIKWTNSWKPEHVYCKYRFKGDLQDSLIALDRSHQMIFINPLTSELMHLGSIPFSEDTIINSHPICQLKFSQDASLRDYLILQSLDDNKDILILFFNIEERRVVKEVSLQRPFDELSNFGDCAAIMANNEPYLIYPYSFKGNDSLMIINLTNNQINEIPLQSKNIAIAYAPHPLIVTKTHGNDSESENNLKVMLIDPVTAQTSTLNQSIGRGDSCQIIRHHYLLVPADNGSTLRILDLITEQVIATLQGQFSGKPNYYSSGSEDFLSIDCYNHIWIWQLPKDLSELNSQQPIKLFQQTADQATTYLTLLPYNYVVRVHTVNAYSSSKKSYLKITPLNTPNASFLIEDPDSTNPHFAQWSRIKTISNGDFPILVVYTTAQKSDLNKPNLVVIRFNERSFKQILSSL